MSFTPTQLDNIDSSDSRNYKHVSTTGTVHTFQLYNGSTPDSAGTNTYITYDSGDRKWRDDGTDHPNTFAVSSTATFTTSGHSDPSVATATDNSDYIHLVRNNGTQQLFTFRMAGWSSSDGTSTEGVATVQWSASFSKNPGNDYWRWTVSGLNTSSTDYIYLYDEMPTATSTHQPIGTRTFSSSSSSSTQYGLFIPDITKTYYVINFLSGGSFEVLATKNFVSRKVFCNFW